MFNINNFKSNINDYGTLRSAHVAVYIFFDNRFGFSVPNSSFAGMLQDLHFMGEATNIPGVSLATTEIRRHGYGVIEKKPYVPIFTDINVVFRSDKKGELYYFFQTWMKMIVNFDGRASINSVTGVLPGQSLYEVAYKENYSATIAIYVMDNQGNEPLQIMLTEAYPIFLGEIPLAWQATNDYVKIPVRFTFKDWYLERKFAVSPANLKEQFRNQSQFGPPLN